MYEHGCLENIKKLYTSTGKCDDKQQYKTIIKSSMVSTPEISTYNSTISPGPSMTFRNPNTMKSLLIFTEVFYVKKKTDILRVGFDKSDLKAIISGSML